MFLFKPTDFVRNTLLKIVCWPSMSLASSQLFFISLTLYLFIYLEHYEAWLDE